VNDVIVMLQALADPTRFAIFECVRGCGGESLYDTETGECDAGTPGAIAACDVRCKIPCSESQMSRHFSALRDAGLVFTERRGRKLYASVNKEALSRISAHFADTSSVQKEIAYV
jgi:DNA-binding transcriptional ArsR family regulator